MAERNARVSRFIVIRRALQLGVAAIWLVGGAGALQAQSTGGAIEGTVLSASDSLPVRQATVQVTGTPLGVLTGEQGSFRIVRIDPGTYTLRVSAPGYEQTTHADVVVTEGESVRVDVYVRPSVIDVPGMVVTASRMTGSDPTSRPSACPSWNRRSFSSATSTTSERPFRSPRA